MLQVDERALRLQYLLQLQSDYETELKRLLDGVQDQLTQLQPGGSVPELEQQLNQYQVRHHIFRDLATSRITPNGILIQQQRCTLRCVRLLVLEHQ